MSKGQSTYRLLFPESRHCLEGIAHLLVAGTQNTASLHPTPRLVVKTLLCQDPQSRSVITAFRRGADRAVRTGGAGWWRLLPETTSRTTCLQTVFNAAWGRAGAPHSWVSLGWDAGPSAGHASFRSSELHLCLRPQNPEHAWARKLSSVRAGGHSAGRTVSTTPAISSRSPVPEHLHRVLIPLLSSQWGKNVCLLVYFHPHRYHRER